MSDKIFSINNSITTTYHLIGHVHWLNNIRKTIKEPYIIRGINISISILLCTYIESVLNNILNNIIEKRIKETNDNEYQKVLYSIQIKLEKASWNQYLDICKVVLPKTLNCYTDNEIWKGIKVLFSLRNVIVHGKSVKSELLFKDDKFEIEYSGVFEIIIDYFKEQKVLKSHQIKSSNHKILSIQSTNHFIKITDKFIDEIVFKIYKDQNIDNWGDYNADKHNVFLSYGLDYDKIYPKPKKSKMKDNDLPF